MRVSNNPPSILVVPEYIDTEDYFMFTTRLNYTSILTIRLRNKNSGRYAMAIFIR